MPEEIERWDPFREMMTLRNRVDHLFESMFARPRGERLATIFDYPALDMYESAGKVMIDVPLPGVKPDEVELTTSGNTLTSKASIRPRRRSRTRTTTATRCTTAPSPAP
jgi:HSP20 family protein